MRIGQRYDFPPERWRDRQRAGRIAWLSIALLLAAATLLALTLGQSQAMKTAWVSDVLTAIPPAAFLVALRYELRPPTERFPFGYFRSISISFLVTAAVLLLVGAYLLLDSVLKLVRRERLPIGTMVLFGHQFWAGWAMIGALAVSMGVGILLGRLKQPLAERMRAKHVHAESEMNRAEWMSEGAAIAGILLVGVGQWWGDAAAAAFISIEIVRDGWHQLRQVVADLMDESPTRLGTTELEELPRTVREAAERLAWVERAAVRLREQGHVIAGDVFVVPRDGTDDLVSWIERASEELTALDWRLYTLTVMPVSHLDPGGVPRTGAGARPGVMWSTAPAARHAPCLRAVSTVLPAAAGSRRAAGRSQPHRRPRRIPPMSTTSPRHAGPDRRTARRRESVERRTHERLRDLCDEVLASYRVATERDPLSDVDRREARSFLSRLGVPTRG